MGFTEDVDDDGKKILSIYITDIDVADQVIVVNFKRSIETYS